MSGPPDEFEWIARGLAPLADGAPEAFGLSDDAAAIPSRPGFDLIVSKDAIVEGVHFLKDDPPDLVARKLIRVNLSDLAAKGRAMISVTVELHDESGAHTLSAAVEWFITRIPDASGNT